MIRMLVAVVAAAALTAAEAPTVNRNAATPEAAPVVAESRPFAVRIPFRNPYDQAIRIASLDASCSCGRLEARERFLLPHAATELDLEIDNRNRSGPQRLAVTAYLSDPALDPIEIVALWTVRAHVQVDSLSNAPFGSTERPTEPGFRDVYRYVAKVRPDELARLRKRVLLSCPPGEAPEGGLRVTEVLYAGDLWAFELRPTPEGAIVLECRARDVDAIVAEGLREEVATVLTNHPLKPRIELTFIAYVGRDAGQVAIDPDATRDKVKREQPAAVPPPPPAMP